MERSRFQLYHRQWALAMPTIRSSAFRRLAMQTVFTPGATRALQLATSLAERFSAPSVEPIHLLWALVLDESRGAEILAAHGLPRENLLRLLPLADDLPAVELTRAETTGELSDALHEVVVEARQQAAR